MAAAWLKLEEYDSAERYAERALVLDPRFVKARYRRGLARKGNLELARAALGMCFPFSPRPPYIMAHGAPTRLTAENMKRRLSNRPGSRSQLNRGERCTS